MYYMRKRTICENILYAKTYYMRKRTICKNVLYAKTYYMQKRIICENAKLHFDLLKKGVYFPCQRADVSSLSCLKKSKFFFLIL